MNFWWWLRTLVLAVTALVMGIVVTALMWNLGIYPKEIFLQSTSPRWYRLLVSVIFLGLIPAAMGGIVSSAGASWLFRWRTITTGLLTGVFVGGLSSLYSYWQMAYQAMGVQGLAWWMLAPFVLPAISGTLMGFIMRYRNAKQRFA
ncbi:hypothetical protein [Planctopirus hydrillae]|uniref:Uncharacterized protein n=1 Tax=Planctopirus hydrillae TaxID=1841610 RepID=A0A1C3E6T4_9PLAN|nr:hypothetical protein [Planctopirus hydrillae]ODA28965.1 hypothetical protein A6X21_10785 [Planctopirus hydrillae]